MTLLDATRRIKALIGQEALVTFEAIARANGRTEDVSVRWYSTETRIYSVAFPTVEAAYLDACQALTGRAVTDVEVGEEGGTA